MAATGEFLNQCTTNAFILHDFTEIAYIVCTVAHPPSTGGPSLAPTPEKNPARLRTTEKQFRQASILAALDADKHELFTFYRKVDVVKDQKTILSKFGFVLRSNSCIISYKAAARVPELFKPDNSRLYRLFVTALLASIELKSPNRVVPLGPRAHLVQEDSSRRFPALWQDETQPPAWHVRKVDMQVIPSGQIVLTIAKDSDVVFRASSDLISDPSNFVIDSPSLVYLAPLGHLARYNRGWCGKMDRGLESDDQDEDNIRRQVWAQHVKTWLQTTRLASEDLEDDVWLELEVFVLQESTNSEDASITRREVYQKVFWPTKLTYAMVMPEISGSTLSQPDLRTDPLQFLENWIQSGFGKKDGLPQQQSDNSDGEDTGVHLFAEDIHFDEMEQPSLNPARFATQQMIYPTPPDAVITHATPGVSSMDGAAMTPAKGARKVSDVSLTVPETDSRARGDRQVSLPRSGFYDEDLFEDGPNDKYGRLPEGDEPNWDFFDPPDIEMEDIAEPRNENAQSSRVDGIGAELMDLGPQLGEVSPGDLVTETTAIDRTNDYSPLDEHGRTSSHGDSANTHNVIGSNETALGVHPPSGIGTVIEPIRRLSHGHSVAGSASARRGSIYEGVQPTSAVLSDNKYSAKGKFWFKDEYQQAHGKQSNNLALAKRPLSPSSTEDESEDDDMSMAAMTSNISSPPTSRKPYWSLYPANVPSATRLPRKDVDRATIRDHVSSIIEVMKLDLSAEHLLDTLMPQLLMPQSSLSLTDDVTSVAQIFIDQISQSVFFRDAVKLHSNAPTDKEDLSIDLAGASSDTPVATLNQMVTMKTMPPTMKARGKIAKMDRVQIELRRNDKELTTHASILPFWDALCLQPQAGPKDVTAFCIYPSSTNVENGCFNLLDRLAEAYSGSNLGTHTTGCLAYIAEQGLIPWTDSQDMQDLHETCQRLSLAISKDDFEGQNLVFYMVSKDRSAQSYVQLCDAFWKLVETMIDDLQGRIEVGDVVLQIVPLDFIASPETLVTPTQAEYVSLAMEVYDRVPILLDDDDHPQTSHAVKLARNIRKNLSFELNASPGEPWSPNGPCLHVAYDYTADRRWIVAAWSDECGTIAFSMSYMLRLPRSKPGRPRLQVLRDIWEVSQDVMRKQAKQRQRGKWRLVVARRGLYETDEAAEWQQISQSANAEKKAICNLMLISVDLNPGLTLTAQRGHIRAQYSAVVGALGTPISTPQAATTSPDQNIPATPTPGGTTFVNAPTPPDHSFDPSNEVDMILVDTMEDSWIVILPYGLNQSHSLLDIRPALATGFIVKVKGEKDEDGLVMLGASLVATTQQASPNVHHYQRDDWLEDVLEQYRRLATLAWIRGCADKVKNLVPWHLATVIKAVRSLEQAGI